MIDITTAVGSAKRLDETVGLVGKVLGKLKAKPDVAAMKLSEALDEIGKTYRAIDEGVAAYLGLAFAAQGIHPDSEALLQVQGGRLVAEVARGRGHCHRIGAIYDTFLDKWFENALDSTEYLMLKEILTALGNADVDLFRAFTVLAGKLQIEADQVLDLILTNRSAAALDRVKNECAPLKALRLQLGDAMKKLYGLRNEFLEIAGVP